MTLNHKKQIVGELIKFGTSLLGCSTKYIFHAVAYTYCIKSSAKDVMNKIRGNLRLKS